MSMLCIGQSTYDISLPIDGWITENMKYRVYGKLECPGGPATNAAILLGKWHEEVYLYSRIGSDAYGSEIKKFLKKTHVHHIHIPDVEFVTPLSVILLDKTNALRTILNCPGVLQETSVVMEESEIDVILTDGHELEISLQFLNHYSNAKSVLDAGSLNERTLPLAKVVTYLVCSETFANQYTNMPVDITKPETWRTVFDKLNELNKNVVITLGERGVLYEEDGTIVNIPSFPVKAIDTNGAGDIFHGAFAYGLKHNMPLKDILIMASKTSSISVTRRGGSTSIPEREEVSI